MCLYIGKFASINVYQGLNAMHEIINLETSANRPIGW